MGLDWIVKDTKFKSVKDFGAKGDGIIDDKTAIQNAINDCQNNGGALFFPKGTYLISGQLTISQSCVILMDKSAHLKAVSAWPSPQTAMILATQNAYIMYAELDCNNVASGIEFGVSGQSANCYADVIKVYNISDNFNVTPAFGVKVTGFNTEINHVETVSGQSGLYVKSASDIYIHSALCVQGITGCWVEGSEHIFFDTLDIDSSRDHGLQAFANNDINWGQTTIWSNKTAYPTLAPTRGVNVDGDKNYSGHIKCIANATTAVKLRNLSDSQFIISIKNTTLYTTGITITTGLDVDATVGSTNSIELHINNNITTPITGQVEFLIPNARIYHALFTVSQGQNNTRFNALSGQGSDTAEPNRQQLIGYNGCVIHFAGKLTSNTLVTSTDSVDIRQNALNNLANIVIPAGSTSMVKSTNTTHPKFVASDWLNYRSYISASTDTGLASNLSLMAVLLPME